MVLQPLKCITPCHVQFNNIWGYPKHGDLGCHVILDNHIARSSIVSIVFHFASRGLDGVKSAIDTSAACPRVKNSYG